MYHAAVLYKKDFFYRPERGMVPPRSPIQNMVIHVAAVAKRQELIQHVLECMSAIKRKEALLLFVYDFVEIK